MGFKVYCIQQKSSKITRMASWNTLTCPEVTLFILNNDILSRLWFYRLLFFWLVSKVARTVTFLFPLRTIIFSMPWDKHYTKPVMKLYPISCTKCYWTRLILEKSNSTSKKRWKALPEPATISVIVLLTFL